MIILLQHWGFPICKWTEQEGSIFPSFLTPVVRARACVLMFMMMIAYIDTIWPLCNGIQQQTIATTGLSISLGLKANLGSPLNGQFQPRATDDRAEMRWSSFHVGSFVSVRGVTSVGRVCFSVLVDPIVIQLCLFVSLFVTYREELLFPNGFIN